METCFCDWPYGTADERNVFWKIFTKFLLFEFSGYSRKNNVLHLDYRLDDTFQDDNNLFWNGVDWLSETGRRVFMEN